MSKLRTHLLSVLRKPGAQSPFIAFTYISLSGIQVPASLPFLPAFQGAPSSSPAQEDGGPVHVLQSQQTWPKVSHPLCSSERLPGRFRKVSLLPACCPPVLRESLCNTEILRRMRMEWSCFFPVWCFPLSPSCEAGFCPGLERRVVRKRHAVLLPHSSCPVTSWHKGVL